MPNIGDPRFEQAVILICAHDETHAMGLRLNEPQGDLSLGHLFDRLEIGAMPLHRDQRVLVGGPVETERGFVLHTDDCFDPTASLAIGGGLAVTATREVLLAMTDPATAPRRSVLALGYAGWGEGQLETELVENAWLAGEPEDDILFDADHETKWARAMARIGVDVVHLSGDIGRA
ncbi:YqgE/AlgH family protein [Brevundimonas aveniformis]|uniref:YqgE/AlgH family protein n=1 Tax=Brevundimonas aveniformis TaxID=370977 RepID=UPI0024934A0C|nr:YqgE/AlgH family protein [Brevundimonas aveniformis]